MRQLLIAAGIAATLALAGCAGTVEKTLTGGDGEEGLAKFTANDLTRAKAIAERQNDVAAVNCWSTLLARVEELGAREPVTEGETGLATAFQTARGIRRGIQAGIPEDVHIACAPLVLDAQKTVRGLLLRAVPFL